MCCPGNQAERQDIAREMLTEIPALAGRMFGQRKRPSYWLSTCIGFWDRTLKQSACGSLLCFCLLASPVFLSIPGLVVPGDMASQQAPAPLHLRSCSSTGDWHCEQPCSARISDTLTSKWPDGRGTSAGSAGSSCRKGQLAVSRTLVCTDSKRPLQLNCDRKPAKPPVFPKGWHFLNGRKDSRHSLEVTRHRMEGLFAFGF